MFKYALLATALFSALPVPSAFAEDGCDGYCRGGGRGGHSVGHYRHNDRGYYRGRPSTVVSFNYGYGPYYRPYPHYRPTRVVYAPQPVYVEPQPQVVYMNDMNSREISSNDGRYCREYQAVSKIGGVPKQTYGTACMQPDGSWEIQS